MNNPEQIKQLLTPIMVAERYLGQPKVKGNRLWYKSPFRNERTASFMVSEEAYHDFGDGWHGDIIDFVERYYNTDFINAMKILSRDFNLPDNEYISKDLENYLKKKREDEKKIREQLDNWFNSTYNKICEELRFWKKSILHLEFDVLEVAYGKISSYEILWEIFFDAINDEKKKLELWRDKEEIEKCLRLRNM